MLTVPCLKNGKIHILDVFVEMHMFFFTQKHLGSIAEHVILHHRNNREQNNRKEIGNFFCFIGTDNERYLSFLCFLMCIFLLAATSRKNKSPLLAPPAGSFFSISYVEGDMEFPAQISLIARISGFFRLEITVPGDSYMMGKRKW